MIAPIAGAPLAPADRGPVLGKEDFLSMLVAQLRNQDPLKPMDGADYAAQLAQFSTVEQLLEIGGKLDRQSTDLARNILLGETQLGASLVGREVVVKGNEIVSTGDEPARVLLELPVGGGAVTIEVLDNDGRTVGTQAFGTLPAGRAVLALDRMDLPAGRYTYRVAGVGTPGGLPGVETFTIGLVEGMSFVNGQVALRLNGTLVPLLDIVEILTASRAADPQSLSQEPATP